MLKIKKFGAVFFAVVLFVMVFSITAFAKTETIELTTRSALLIDKSGSMEKIAAVEAVVGQYNPVSYDAVVYFDNNISTDSNFVGGGNSYICEVIDELADAGFTHITVVTDGEQWPADYSSLSVYTDLDLTIHLVEEDDESSEFINQLKGRLVNSDLKVVKPDGTEELILDEYEPPVYTVEIPEDSSSNTVVGGGCCDGNCCKCKHTFNWYWLLLLLIPILLFLLWWLFRNLKIAKRIKNSHAVVDCSRSMANYLHKLYRVCKRIGVSSNEEIIRFGEGTSVETMEYLKNVKGEGRTDGVEGLLLALDQGWEEITLISDLDFNGRELENTTFSKKFKKITAIVPKKHSSYNLNNLSKIADEVEVLHL